MENENIERCDVCDTQIEWGFSLCDECGENHVRWDEDTDTHHMKDGSEYRFERSVGKYLVKE